MAAPLHNNLPPQSQQWVRDIEHRMKTLEQQNQLLQVTANQNATQIGSVQGALAFARTGVDVGMLKHDVSYGTNGGSDVLTLSRTVDIPEWATSATSMFTPSVRLEASTLTLAGWRELLTRPRVYWVTSGTPTLAWEGYGAAGQVEAAQTITVGEVFAGMVPEGATQIVFEAYCAAVLNGAAGTNIRVHWLLPMQTIWSATNSISEESN